jgi:hypothetical protein
MIRTKNTPTSAITAAETALEFSNDIDIIYGSRAGTISSAAERSAKSTSSYHTLSRIKRWGK